MSEIKFVGILFLEGISGETLRETETSEMNFEEIADWLPKALEYFKAEKAYGNPKWYSVSVSVISVQPSMVEGEVDDLTQLFYTEISRD